MSDNIFILILCFVLLFVAFNPLVLEPDAELPTFNEMFAFGYEITIGTVEMAASIFKGPDVFIDRFSIWRINVFGENTIVSYLDRITDDLPVVRTLKNFAETVLSPLEDVFSDLSEWIRDKIE